MSNKEAAKTYEEIIDEVINESRQDFEDIGIDESTLLDLRQIWRDNLAQTRVANFSWAPHLAETDPVISTATTVDQSSSVAGVTSTESSSHTNTPSNSANTTNNSTTGTNSQQQNVNGSEFSFEVQDDTGKLAKSLQKQRDAELKKERTMASLDSDDINSDLDDSDDDAEGFDEDGEDGEGMIMLCLYEKVLRVKNKWKCNLRDGILNVNGKDYTFQKATGESEW